MANKIQLRRGTASEWTSVNPILSSGEPGFETDTNKEKIGDGTTAWNSLPYLGGDSSLFLGTYLSLSALESAHPTPDDGSEAHINEVGATQVQKAIWDNEDEEWVIVGSVPSDNTPELITLIPDDLSFDKKEKTFDYVQSGAQSLEVTDTSFGAGALMYGTWLTDGNEITKTDDINDYSGLFTDNIYTPNAGETLDVYFATLLRNGIVETRLNIINLGVLSFSITGFSGEGLNTYVDLNLSQGGYGAADGTTPLASSDFIITNFTSGGATAISISSITKTSGSTLTGGEKTIRINLNVTGSPSGLESFQIKPADNTSIYNIGGTAMVSSKTSGIINLINDVTPITITTYGLASDNSYVFVALSRGAWGDDTLSTPISISDLIITGTVYSGITNISIASVGKTSGGALTGGETTIKVNLTITGIADGSERFAIQPIDSTSIYDSSLNALVSTETTGVIYIVKQGTPYPLTIQIGVKTTNISESPIGIYHGANASSWNNRALADDTMPALSNGYLVQDILDISDNGDVAALGFNITATYTSYNDMEAGVFRGFLYTGNEINSLKNGSNVSIGVKPFPSSKLRVRRSGSVFITEYTKGGNEFYFGNVIAYTSTALMYVNMYIVKNTNTCSNPKILP